MLKQSTNKKDHQLLDSCCAVAWIYQTFPLCERVDVEVVVSQRGAGLVPGAYVSGQGRHSLGTLWTRNDERICVCLMCHSGPQVQNYQLTSKKQGNRYTCPTARKYCVYIDLNRY